MIRKYPIALSAAAALAAGGAILVPTSSGQSELPDVLTLEMRHREAKISFVDEAPRMRSRRSSESPGDTVIARGRLRTPAGASAGRVHSEFVVTGGKSPRTTEQAIGTLVLSDGQIAIHGAFANTGSDTDVIAIVGGTGRYNGAKGHAEIVTSRSAVTFILRFAR